MAPHELHQRDAVVNAFGLDMRAVQHARGFLHRGQVAERARHERHVVVHRLRDAHHGQGMPAPFGFLIKIIAAALRSVAANSEEHVHAPPDEVVHRELYVHRPAGRAQHRAALLMDMVHELRRQHDGLLPRAGSSPW